MRLRVTTQEAEDILVAMYSGIKNEEALLDAYSDCNDVEGQKIKRKIAAAIQRYHALRKRIGDQIRDQKNRRKA